MALTEDIRRMLGFEDGPENNAEISFKIKPLGAVGQIGATPGVPSDPTTVGGSGTQTGGPGGIGTGPGGEIGQTPQLPTGFGQGGQSVVPLTQQMTKKNPTLVTHPLGAQTDDMYEAAVAQLQFDTQQKYASLLQELGFMGDDGTFMPGTLETTAIRNRAELERQRQLQLQDVVENAVRGGTVFSGRRATKTQQTNQPYDAALSELTTRLSQELANRYQGISGLTQEFELGRNQLLSEAAERIKAGLMTGPVGGEGGGPSGGGSGGMVGQVDQYLQQAGVNWQGLADAIAGYTGGGGGTAATPGGSGPIAGGKPGPAPPRPKGMPSTWRWNSQKGVWQSPDGKYFLLPGRPWGQTSAPTRAV